MSLLQWLIDKINHPAQHLVSRRIESANTDTATPIIPLESGKNYFRLWLSEMYLKDDVKWFQDWYPAVHSLVSFRAGTTTFDVPNIAGSLNLEKVSAASINQVVQLDFPMTTLIPFNGGTVEITAGLLAMKGGNYLNNFIGVLGGFANLLVVPQLSAALAIAGPVADGIQKLLGNADDGTLKIGLHQTLVAPGGGGSNDLQSGYFIVIAANVGEIDETKLWVVGGRLRYGNSLTDNKPLVGYTYMLFRIESRTERDDFLSMTTIADPFNKAIAALGDGDSDKADSFIRASVVAALQSTDLTQADKSRVARALKDEYDQAKQSLGLGLAPVGEKTSFESAFNKAMTTNVITALNNKPSYTDLFG